MNTLYRIRLEALLAHGLKRMSMPQTGAIKAFLLFAAILFVGMQIGGVIQAALGGWFTTGNAILDGLIAWIVIIVPAYLVFRKWKLARKAMAEGNI